MSHWYAIHTKPRSEALAVEHLARQGFECRLPRLRRHVRRTQGMIERAEPLFPRYLFLRADPTRQDLSKVRSTRGVSGLVRFGAAPAQVPETVVAAIDARTDEGYVQLDPPELVPGTQVRVTDGPLTGIEGIFRERSAQRRALLLVHLMGEWCSVTVPITQLGARL